MARDKDLCAHSHRRTELRHQESELSTLPSRKDPHMLYTLAVILIVLWLLGMVSAYTLGGFIHVLLVVAVIAVLLRVISGRSPV